jgi:hypothetical protein
MQQQFARRDEQLAIGQGPLRVDPTPLIGEWINTNPATTGITRVTIAGDQDDLRIAIWTAGTEGAEPRRRLVADVIYSNGPAAAPAMAMSASYEDEFEKTLLEANLSLGLLVIATCHTLKNPRGRANYFLREFFHFAEQPLHD